MREDRQMRSVATEFQTRTEADDLYISGYFSVFGSNYEPVSYTHLDVYKRQVQYFLIFTCWNLIKS